MQYRIAFMVNITFFCEKSLKKIGGIVYLHHIYIMWKLKHLLQRVFRQRDASEGPSTPAKLMTSSRDATQRRNAEVTSHVAAERREHDETLHLDN
jgi:hypothetical protein